MKHVVHTVFDRATCAYLPPFYEQTMASARRAFAAAVNKPDHPFNQNPQDYILFYLGEFDDGTGEFLLNKAPENQGVAVEFVEEKHQPGLLPDGIPEFLRVKEAS